MTGWIVRSIAGFIALLGSAAPISTLASAYPFSALGYIFAVPFSAILVHETGHAVAATLVGWRVWIFHASPFAWRLKPFAFGFVGHMGGPDFGGFVEAYPKHANADTRARYTFLVAGGPIVSWVAGVTTVVWAAVTDAPDLIRAPIWGFGMISLAGAIVSSWPLRSANGTFNDAALIADALRAPERRDPRSYADSVAYGLYHRGIPISALEPWMTQAIAGARRDQSAAANYFEFVGALESGDPAAARGALDALLLGRENASAVRVLDAYLQSSLEGAAAEAESTLASIGSLKSAKDDVMLFHELTLVEILRAAEEHGDAKSRLNRVEKRLAAGQPFIAPIWRTLVGQARDRLMQAPDG